MEHKSKLNCSDRNEHQHRDDLWTRVPKQIGKPPGGGEPVGFKRAAQLFIAQCKADIPQHNVLPHPNGGADDDITDEVACASRLHEDSQPASIWTSKCTGGQYIEHRED